MTHCGKFRTGPSPVVTCLLAVRRVLRDSAHAAVREHVRAKHQGDHWFGWPRTQTPRRQSPQCDLFVHGRRPGANGHFDPKPELKKWAASLPGERSRDTV